MHPSGSPSFQVTTKTVKNLVSRCDDARGLKFFPSFIAVFINQFPPYQIEACGINRIPAFFWHFPQDTLRSLEHEPEKNDVNRFSHFRVLRHHLGCFLSRLGTARNAASRTGKSKQTCSDRSRG